MILLPGYNRTFKLSSKMSPTATKPPGSPHDGLLGRPQSSSHSLLASVSLPPTASIFPFRFVSGQSPHLASQPSVYQSKDTRYKQAKLQEIQIENARKKSQGFLQKYEALEYRADRHRATWKGFIGPEQLGLIPVVHCWSPVPVQRCPPVIFAAHTLTITTTNLYKIETTPRILPQDALDVSIFPPLYNPKVASKSTKHKRSRPKTRNATLVTSTCKLKGNGYRVKVNNPTRFIRNSKTKSKTRSDRSDRPDQLKLSEAVIKAADKILARFSKPVKKPKPSTKGPSQHPTQPEHSINFCNISTPPPFHLPSFSTTMSYNLNSHSSSSSQSLRELEQLRFSSPDNAKTPPARTPVKRRAESRSPERQKSRGHTPRKDTPKKIKRKRIQCRNMGCSDGFVDPHARERHELYRCKNRVSTTESLGSSKNIFEIPSHSELNLNDTCCRFPGCGSVFKRKQARKKHETDRHRYHEVKGRTRSPLAFSSTSTSPALSDSAQQRPQSCPPHFSGLSTPAGQRRESSTSISDSEEELSSPSLSLTPPPTSPLPRSLFATPNSSSGSGSNICPFCYFTFKNAESYWCTSI